MACVYDRTTDRKCNYHEYNRCKIAEVFYVFRRATVHILEILKRDNLNTIFIIVIHKAIKVNKHKGFLHDCRKTLVYNVYMKFLDPADALKQFGVYGTQEVVDLGSSSGHFALAAAKRLEGGRLFAVDIEKEMLSRLVAEAHAGGLHNVHTLWGDVAALTGIPLAGETIDRAIAANILFSVDDRDAFVQEVKRLLRPGGKVLLIEWRESMPGGPHPKHKVSEEVALALFRRHGFEMERSIDAGDMHYGMILVRA